jgi:hypothetical protein
MQMHEIGDLKLREIAPGLEVYRPGLMPLGSDLTPSLASGFMPGPLFEALVRRELRLRRDLVGKRIRHRRSILVDVDAFDRIT